MHDDARRSLRASLLLCLMRYRSISASARDAKGHVSDSRLRTAYPERVADAASSMLGGVHDRFDALGSCTRWKELHKNWSVIDSHAPAHSSPSKYHSIRGRHEALMSHSGASAPQPGPRTASAASSSRVRCLHTLHRWHNRRECEERRECPAPQGPSSVADYAVQSASGSCSAAAPTTLTFPLA